MAGPQEKRITTHWGEGGGHHGINLQSSPGSGPQEAFEAAGLCDSHYERQTTARPRSRCAKTRQFAREGRCRCLDLTMPPNCPFGLLQISTSSGPCPLPLAHVACPGLTPGTLPQALALSGRWPSPALQSGFLQGLFLPQDRE